MKIRVKRVAKMDKERISPLYKCIKALIRLFYPKIEIVGLENLPDEPCIVVANHCQMHGPIACELYFPENHRIWCEAEMMAFKEIPAYAFQDFWSQKPKRSHWFYRILSFLIAPLSVLIFNNAKTIGVYRDARVMSTFRSTIAALSEGEHVIIFPEYDKKYNHILYCFQEGFVDTARMYCKRSGIAPSFVPMYIAPKLRKMYIGKPIPFDANAPIEAERKRICERLMTEITDIAEACPLHTVVPYRNIPKRLYPKNVSREV